MASTTVRIDRETHTKLQTLARGLDLSMQDILAHAVEAFRRDHFLRRANESYAALRADPIAWQQLRDERTEWDVTLMDGLKDDPYPWEEAGHAASTDAR